MTSLTTASLVPPAPGLGDPQRALLLYPEELGKKSKANLFDEGLFLSPLASRAPGPWLRRLSARGGALAALWPRPATAFRREVEQLLTQVGEPGWDVYSIRHGWASHAVAVDQTPLRDVQARLRHAAPSSTARYSRQARYLAECHKLAPSLVAYAELVESRLDLILGAGRGATAPPRAAPQPQ